MLTFSLTIHTTLERHACPSVCLPHTVSTYHAPTAIGSKKVLRVFLDARAFKTLPVNEHANVREVVALMIRKCRDLDCKTWALYERKGTTGMCV
jgi:hypothetical protein